MTPREIVIEAMARTILLNGYLTPEGKTDDEHFTFIRLTNPTSCLLYTSDAADE